jgi:hypothetical protein
MFLIIYKGSTEAGCDSGPILVQTGAERGLRISILMAG